MKPSLFPEQISKIWPAEPPRFWGSQSAAPKPLPRLFLDPSYGPAAQSSFCKYGDKGTVLFISLAPIPTFENFLMEPFTTL